MSFYHVYHVSFLKTNIRRERDNRKISLRLILSFSILVQFHPNTSRIFPQKKKTLNDLNYHSRDRSRVELPRGIIHNLVNNRNMNRSIGEERRKRSRDAATKTMADDRQTSGNTKRNPFHCSRDFFICLRLCPIVAARFVGTRNRARRPRVARVAAHSRT